MSSCRATREICPRRLTGELSRFSAARTTVELASIIPANLPLGFKLIHHSHQQNFGKSKVAERVFCDLEHNRCLVIHAQGTAGRMPIWVSAKCLTVSMPRPLCDMRCAQLRSMPEYGQMANAYTRSSPSCTSIYGDSSLARHLHFPGNRCLWK